mmetsp:Transcript_11443/g.31693  ORF Transcript_11443/g.31693 Transcript_11443/m.31693 type:complete len:243 (-) Transcript_11443:663-1391(-)
MPVALSERRVRTTRLSMPSRQTGRLSTLSLVAGRCQALLCTYCDATRSGQRWSASLPMWRVDPRLARRCRIFCRTMVGWGSAHLIASTSCANTTSMSSRLGKSRRHQRCRHPMMQGRGDGKDEMKARSMTIHRQRCGRARTRGMLARSRVWVLNCSTALPLITRVSFHFDQICASPELCCVLALIHTVMCEDGKEEKRNETEQFEIICSTYQYSQSFEWNTGDPCCELQESRGCRMQDESRC